MLASRLGVRLRCLTCRNAARSSSSGGGGGGGAKSALVRVPEAQLSRLSNGLRVASEDWNTETCTVGVWLLGGSRYESDATSGAAHLLRQLAFSGTGRRSAADIRREADSRGAELGARASRELASHSVTCFSADLPWAVELLADTLRNSTLDEGLADGRRAALAELREAESDLGLVASDYLHAAAYQGTPMSLAPLGQADSLAALTPATLRQLAAELRQPQRLVVAAAGAVDHSELADLCRQHFGDMPGAVGSAEEAEGKEQPAPVRFTGSSLLDRDDHLPYAHVSIAVEGPGAASADCVPLLLASAYIGSWDRAQGGGNSVASRLARQAHDAFDGGIVSYRSFFREYSDTSLWGMHFVANQESVNYFTKDFQTDWMELSQDVREFDLARAKNALLTSLYTRLDGTDRACSELARHVLRYGRRIPLKELEARIAGVSAAGLADAASGYIYDRCPAVAGVGPIEGLPDYNRIRSKMWFYRV